MIGKKSTVITFQQLFYGNCLALGQAHLVNILTENGGLTLKTPGNVFSLSLLRKVA